MEQTKIDNKTENKPESTAAPDNNDKPKKERKPLTEAQRLKRQKMIVLPAMVLVFIGAMWLIFAPSSGKEQEPGTSGYNIEMPDADKENRRIIGDKAKAYEQGAMEERQENRSRAMQQLGDLFDRETTETNGDSDFDLANPGGTEETVKPAPKTIQSSAAAYRDLNATLGNFYEPPKNDNAEMDELLERIATLESELESGKERSSTMDEQVALMEKSYELAAKYMGGQNGTQAAAGHIAEPSPRAESRKEHGKTRQAGDASGGVLARTAHEQCRICRFLLARAQPQFQHGGGRYNRIGQEHHTGMCLWGAERDGRAGGQVAAAGADGSSRPDHSS